jgi:hypothetical protein
VSLCRAQSSALAREGVRQPARREASASQIATAGLASRKCDRLVGAASRCPHARIDYELIAIAIAVPPLVLLAVGAALVWAMRGFFRQQ